jgi:hypothetical protein
MSAFSAEEDRALLLLVVAFEDQNGVIDWNKVMNYIQPTTKTEDEYKQRLQYLKIEDTTQLRTLPSSYVAGSSLMGASTNRSTEEIYEAIDEIFGHFTVADVKQPSGAKQLNAGEIAPVGVTAMVQAIDISTDDIFLDIGSGTGSVLAQIILQTPVRKCFGLEIREALSQKSRDTINAMKIKYARLLLIDIITGDIKDLSVNTAQDFSTATYVFCNNLVFTPEDSLAVSTFLCKSLMCKFALVTDRFCARCSSACTNEFCMSWSEVKVVAAQSCWKDEPVDIYIYKRKGLVDMLASF